jgi:hypothetical protein
MRRRACAGIWLLAIGCGGSAARQPTAGPPPPKSEVAAPSAAVARSASDELRRRWPFGDDAQFVLYGDFAGFVKTELVSGLVPELLAMARGSMSDLQRECLQTLVEGVREVAIGSRDQGPLFLIRFDEAAIKPGSSACLRAVSAGQPIELAGATAAFAIDNDVVALQPGFVVFGSRSVVSQALKADGSGRWPPGLELPPDTHLSWRAQMSSDGVSAAGTLASAHDFFRIAVKADLESDKEAALLESKFNEGRNDLATRIAAEPTIKMALPAFDAMRLTRDGRTLSFVLDLREPPLEQARDVGMLSALAVSGVRKYLLSSKLAEARVTLANIAKSEVGAWGDLPAAKRKLSSLPPVPKEVPHGMKYQSAPSEWKRWEAVKFSLQGPQYFQYEVVASKDGKRAEIIARGDLNGDGKSSELKLKLNVNPKGNVLDVAQQIEEKDPEE